MDQATSDNDNDIVIRVNHEAGIIEKHAHCFTDFMPYDRTHKYRVCQDSSCRELEIIEVKA